MKRILLLLPLLLLLSALPARAQLANARGWCEDGAQNVITSGLTSTTQVQASYPQCTVSVSTHGGGAATIFSTGSSTPLSNPFTASSNGQWIFYAANGEYDITLSGAGFPSPVTYSDVFIGGSGGGTITGSGVAGQNTYWTGTTAIGGDAQNTWNAITHTAQIGTTQPDMPNFPSLSIYNQGLSIQENTATGAAATPAVFYSYDVSGVAKSSGAGGTQAYTTGLGTATGWNVSSEVQPGAGQSLTGAASNPDSVGQIGYATTNGPATSTTGFATAFHAITENLNAGTLTWGADFDADAVRNTGGGALTNAAGTYFRPQTAGTNNYGAYFEDFGSAANTYGIFQAGTNTKNTLARATVSSLTASTCVGADSNKQLVSNTNCAPAGAATRDFGTTFGDTTGPALTSGPVVYFTVPYACTIAAWNISVDAGTATLDIWKIATGTAIPTVANTITAAALPAIASGTSIHSTTLSGWTTAVTANDIFGLQLKTVSTAKFVELDLQCNQ